MQPCHDLSNGVYIMIDSFEAALSYLATIKSKQFISNCLNL